MKKVVNIFKAIGKIFTAPFRGYKKLKKPIRRVICLILVAAIGAGGYYGWDKYKSSKTSSKQEVKTSIVRRGNLTNSITGSGTVEPIEQREIVPEVNGKIVESPFEEGDSVKTGDVLYRFEMTAATNAIKAAENNVEKAQTTLSNRKNNIEKVRDNLAKLTITSTESGKISDLSLLVGSEASGKICSVTNTKEQTATIPFNVGQVGNIKSGDRATVAIDKYMINTSGKVVRKYTASDTLSSGAKVHYVEILLSNDYAIEENVNVTATVHTTSGDISSASYGSVKYAAPVTVNAEQKGKVKKVNFKNGDWVNKGEVIAVLENSDLAEELKSAQQSYNEAEMNLTEAMNNLEDKKEEANEYIVTSPIDGVVLTKDYTVGDTIKGQNATTMMVVADMSKMKFTISADELDIAKIQLGQNVSVTADALQNQRLTGVITSVSKLGTASNGVTNYPIEVTINQPGELMPGMNVSAQIIIEQAYNSLYLPAEAVEYYDGKYYVTIVGEVENMPEPTIQMGGRGGFSGMNRQGGARTYRSQTPTQQQTTPQSQAPTQQQTTPQSQTPTKQQTTPQSQTPTQQQTTPQSQTPTQQQTTPQNAEKQNTSGWQRGERGGFSGMNRQGRNMPEATQGQSISAQQTTQPVQQQTTPRQTSETAAPAVNTPKEAQTENNKEQANDEKTKDNKSAEDSQAKNQNNESAKDEKQSGENTNRDRSRQENNRENLKIKYYDKEQRVEVKIGIKTDTAYQILEGVEYGQVVKNTVQITQSGSRNSGMGGGFGGGFGGMGGGFGGMSGGNRQSGRNNMGGRR